MFPTLLEAIGGNASKLDLDGKSLLSLLQDGADSVALEDWRSLLDLEHSTCYNETNHWSALTDGNLKFIFHVSVAAIRLWWKTKLTRRSATDAR